MNSYNSLTIGITTHGQREYWLRDLVDSLFYFNRNISFKLIIVDNC